MKEINKLNDKKLINGCANITGGGLIENLTRVIPNKFCLNIDLSKIKIKPIFKWLKQNNIKDHEMLRTFNCGVGFCIILEPKNLNKVKKIFTKEYKPYLIGKITPGRNKVKIDKKIDWS